MPNSPAQKRIDEYLISKIANAIAVVRRAISHGISFDYLLVDSWFTCAELVTFITSRHIKCHLLGMVKLGNTKYLTSGKQMTAKTILGVCKKRNWSSIAAG